MTASRKASSSVVRFVRTAIEAPATERETIEIAKAGLVRVATELGRLGEMLESERLWEASDVARFFNVHRNWVYQQASCGKLPSIRVGGLLRFDPSAVRALAADPQHRTSFTQGMPQRMR